MSAHDSSLPSILSTSDLVVRYGETTVLHDVHITFPAAAVTAIVGANGSGKSTLLEALAGVTPLSRGAVRRAYTGRTTLLVQRPQLSPRLPLTVRDCVRMGTWARPKHAGERRRDRELRVDEAISTVGLDALATRQLSSLSGGQRQRALLAQGLVQRPDVLLLDEPATGLDTESRQCVRACCRSEAARGATVIVATHEDEAIADADWVVSLDAGRSSDITVGHARA